jgi:hypothetical protein
MNQVRMTFIARIANLVVLDILRMECRMTALGYIACADAQRNSMPKATGKQSDHKTTLHCGGKIVPLSPFHPCILTEKRFQNVGCLQADANEFCRK